MAQVLVQFMRAELYSPTTNESENAKTNRKINFLHQILIIANWIQSFDPNKIDHCFDNSFMQLPSEMIKQF